METQMDNLSEQQMKTLDALLTHPGMGAAAQSLGIGRTSLYRRLNNDPVLAEAFRAARVQAVTGAVARLQQRAGDMVEIITAVASDPNTSAATRVRAAELVLEFAFRGVELEDHEARLAELERRYMNAETAKRI